MKPLRALGFRFVGLPSIEDIQWAKGNFNRRTMHADRRRTRTYHGFHRPPPVLLMRMEFINTTQPKMKAHGYVGVRMKCVEVRDRG